MVVLILATASCFSSVFMGSGGGDVVQELILGSGFGKWGMFIIMMIILFFLGMFIDWIGIILICFRFFSPSPLIWGLTSVVYRHHCGDASGFLSDTALRVCALLSQGGGTP
jgi:TRAP-type mannitol/chloroaromatic compound transport system permease large subunit